MRTRWTSRGPGNRFLMVGHICLAMAWDDGGVWEWCPWRGRKARDGGKNFSDAKRRAEKWVRGK